MMDLGHFANLHGRARTRKAVLILERIEREWRDGQPGAGCAIPNDGAIVRGSTISMEGSSPAPFPNATRDFAYARALAEFLATSEESSQEVRCAALEFLARSEESGLDEARRALNGLRHRLAAISGQSPADWDFISSPRPGRAKLRRSSGMRVYLEDIRSPFNVGSIFRSAEALGFDEVLLSPDCADPLHSRALRTSMGTVERLPWRRVTLAELSGSEGSFALEVGGAVLGEFAFPQPGLMILGSEELGVSSEAMRICSRGAVEIPLVGAKASLNVATAFGIAGYSWLAYLNSCSQG